MAESSNANNMPEGMTLIFGSWALTADRSGGFTGHLIAPKEPKANIDDQHRLHLPLIRKVLAKF